MINLSLKKMHSEKKKNALGISLRFRGLGNSSELNSKKP